MAEQENLQLSDDQLEHTEFSDLIVMRIGELAVPAPVHDPYQRAQPGVPLQMSGMTFHRDGQITFSKEYETRRVIIGDEFELIYSHLSRLNRSELYIHTFEPPSGLISRLHFSQVDREGLVRKYWEGNGFSRLLIDPDYEGNYFFRDLNPKEELELKKVILRPLEECELLRKVTSVSSIEQEAIRDNKDRVKESNEKLRKDLDDISRARWWAATEAHNYIID